MGATSENGRRPASGGLFHTLAAGLDQTEREQTLNLIRQRLFADRAAAAAGQRERQVDVGTRTRARRRRGNSDDSVSSRNDAGSAPER
ncbi:hypothetical protein, partial [Frankia sp. AgB1.8]|uniref:hypothetical protein n=1 Tax=Frankia sp. AgB1.8 TaxID=2792839 RepID=UPI001EE417B7